MTATKKAENKEAEEAKKPAAKKASASKKGGEYVYAIGRRKRATAQVRLYPTGKKGVTVNGKERDEYFKLYELRNAVTAPLTKVGMEDAGLEIKVVGGGMRGQAEAARLGVSRALTELNDANRKPLKSEGYLRRDPREKERKKFGLKKARKSSQWAKR